MATYGALDEVFIALADPTRRAVIRRLDEGAASVGKLAEPSRLQQWWVPTPTAALVDQLNVHPGGTEYRVVVRHGDPADRNRHDELGFFDGWESGTSALASLVGSETTI